jgi:hypothetical protein
MDTSIEKERFVKIKSKDLEGKTLDYTILHWIIEFYL